MDPTLMDAPPDAAMADPMGAPMSEPPPELVASTAALLADDPPIIPEDSLLLSSDADILKTATERMDEAVKYRAPFETKWRAAWLDWMLQLRGEAKSWHSRVKIPVVYQQVTSALPTFVAAIFDSGKLFEVAGTKPGTEAQARAVQDMLEYFLRVRMPAERECSDWLKYALIFGTGVLRASWRRESGTVRATEKVDVPLPGATEPLTAGTRTVNKPDEVVENRPEVECIDLWNWFPAPYVLPGHETPWAFERVETTVGLMRKQAESGLFGVDGSERVDRWLESKPEKQSPETTWNGANTRAATFLEAGLTTPFNTDVTTDGDRLNSRIVYWVMSARDYRIVISGDGTQVLGKMPNPYNHGDLPYVVHCFDRIPKSPFGRGVGDILADIQKQVDFNYNKGNDAAQLSINKPLALRGAGNMGVNLVWQPGLIIRLRDPDDLKPLDVKNPMGDVQAMNAELSAHADRATGLNGLSRGEAPSGANTATEFAGVQSEYRMRMSGHAREIRVSMSRLGRLLVSMIQQFVDAKTAVRIVGPDGLDWREVDPAELVGQFDVVSTANFAKTNPALRRNDLVALTPLVATHPLVDQSSWLKEVFAGFEIEHPERLIRQPPPPMRDPMLEQMALDMGIDVEPSPDEVTTGGINAHLQAHLAAMQVLSIDPTRGAALAATRRHVEKTMQMAAVMQQQMGVNGPPPGAGGPPQGGKPDARAGANPERRNATRLGQAQGSDGPPGRSPGPAQPPGRPAGGEA